MIWRPYAILCKKLKNVKAALINLNKQHGNVHTLVQGAHSKLYSIQDNPIDLALYVLLANEVVARKHLAECFHKETTLLIQKSRVKWLSLGDGNNNFFHNQVRANWNRDKILALENSEGALIFGHKSVSSVVVDYFASTIDQPSNVQPHDLFSFIMPSISEAQATLVEAPIMDELILKTVDSMKRNKAPGPDGFSVEFFVAVWDIVDYDFCAAIKHFFATSFMHKGLNSTCIVLILKLPTPTAMKDLRPISLCSDCL
ncbi:hypothetical protein AgCh_004900 [Apium graveolens]